MRTLFGCQISVVLTAGGTSGGMPPLPRITHEANCLWWQALDRRTPRIVHVLMPVKVGDGGELLAADSAGAQTHEISTILIGTRGVRPRMVSSTWARPMSSIFAMIRSASRRSPA